MNFDNYRVIFIKHWKLIVSCFLAVGLGTCIASKLMTPIYQSEVIIQVSVRSGTNQPDYNNLLASDQLVQTEAQLATTTSVLEAVAAHHTGFSEDQHAKEVTSVPSFNTKLFTITVQDASATRAAALANDIATTLIQQQTQAIQDANQHAQQQIQQEINATQQQINDVTNHIAQLQASGGSFPQITPLQNRLTTKSTLLIDADLHRPTQQQHFHLSADKREESIALARALVQEGIHTAVATPHYNDKFLRRSAAEIREQVSAAQQSAITQANDTNPSRKLSRYEFPI